MVKVDYSKFSEVNIVDDLPIFLVGNVGNMRNDLFEYLNKLGIKTLEDLFNAYDDGCFNDKRKRYNVEMKGQTELLMSHYMGTPLIADDILETGVSLKSQDDINEWYVNDKLKKALLRVGISHEEYYLLYQYCMEKHKKVLADENGVARILKIMSTFAQDREYQGSMTTTAYSTEYIKLIQNIRFKANFFEKYLEEKRYLEDGLTGIISTNTIIDRNVVQNLEAQMKFLLRARENIDSQIELLQIQLSNVKSTGGIRK